MKSTCSTVEKNIAGYVDGMIAQDLSWQIEMHIASCSKCAKLVRTMQQTVSLLGQVQPRTLSDSFDSKLAAKIAAVSQHSPQQIHSQSYSWLDKISEVFGTSRRPAVMRLGFAAAALTLFVSFFVTPHGNDSITKPSLSPAGITSAATAAKEDSLFVAACSNEQNQSSDSQTLSDPAAQTLAARFDAISTGADQPVSAASPAQD